MPCNGFFIHSQNSVGLACTADVFSMYLSVRRCHSPPMSDGGEHLESGSCGSKTSAVHERGGRVVSHGCMCAWLQGRIKSLYSMYRKMIRKSVSLREVFDALALRVVVDDQNGFKMQRAIEVCCSQGKKLLQQR